MGKGHYSAHNRVGVQVVRNETTEVSGDAHGPWTPSGDCCDQGMCVGQRVTEFKL